MNPPGFKEYVLDQLRDLPEVQCRAMFGGHGLYQGGTFFGILFRGRLYFKTDDQSIANYEARGMEPFIYEKPDGKTMTMAYHEVPAEVWRTRRLSSNGRVPRFQSPNQRKNHGTGPRSSRVPDPLPNRRGNLTLLRNRLDLLTDRQIS